MDSSGLRRSWRYPNLGGGGGGGDSLSTVDSWGFGRSSGESNLGSAFDAAESADRVIRVEIVAEPPAESRPGNGGGLRRHRKRRSDEKEFDLDNSRPESEEEYEAYEENYDEKEAVALIGVSPPGDDSSWRTECSQVLRVKSIYICSAIFAAESPFFDKLFSNGMKESEQQHVTLKINASEEAAVMELLRFMCNGNLSTTSPSLLLDVLVAADKFQVVSCMRHCSWLLANLPMTADLAFFYLNLPCSVSMPDAVLPLTNAATDFLATEFKDLTKHQNMVMDFPLSVIEAILSRNDLKETSEDEVYNFALKWAHARYPEPEERREILNSRLLPLIRFSRMSCSKLRTVLEGSEFDSKLARKFVLEALLFKAEKPHHQKELLQGESTSQMFAERDYHYHPVKVVEFDQPFPQSVAFLDLKREECAKLFPGGRLYSRPFYLAGHGFFLAVHCDTGHESASHCFGLFLGNQENEKDPKSFTVEYKFAVRARPSGEFVNKYGGTYAFTGEKVVGCGNIFPWSSFIHKDSPYFINDVLHLRAELTAKQSVV
uniref:BTB domain-containing protein n=1 Tax=Ananas comosus var. bracteatus TaxID=296719 RepID=A0A6V7QVM6_ANACO